MKSDLRQKFVIDKNGHFRMGRVIFHKQLDKESQGGGYWFFVEESNTVYLYSKSEDFGTCTKEMIEAEMEEIQMRFRGAKVKFVEDSNKNLYEILKEDMDELEAMDLISSNDFV